MRDMKRHMKTVHKESITVPCGLCGTPYSSGRIDSFRKHLQKYCPMKGQIENGEFSMEKELEVWKNCLN